MSKNKDVRLMEKMKLCTAVLTVLVAYIYYIYRQDGDWQVPSGTWRLDPGTWRLFQCNPGDPM